MTEHTLGKPIAMGRTAEIYAWEPGWILKLYFDWFDPDDVDYERRMATAISATGLPVPAVGEIVSAAGRVGLLYERYDGISMWDDLDQHPTQMVAHSRTLAALHAEMHARPIQADIPPMHQKLERKIKAAKPVPEPLKTTLLKMLESLPEGDRLCHGDFHPANVLLSQPKPVIIDWIDASVGNPLADVARTSIIALGAAHTQEKRLDNLAIRAVHAVYLRHYFKLRPDGREEYRCWLPIVAAARISEGISELEPWLMAQANKIFA